MRTYSRAQRLLTGSHSGRTVVAMTTSEHATDPSQSQRLRDFGRRHPLTPIVLGVLLYSVGPVFVQASTASGPVFSMWRLWCGVPLLAAATALQARASGGWPELRAWRIPVLAGVAFGVHQLTMFSAIKATSVADVTLVNALGPVVTAVLAVPMFSERPGATFRFWSVIAMIGTAVVVFGGSVGPEGDPLGMILALANVVAFAVFFLLSKRSRDVLPVLPFLLGVMTIAALSVSGYVLLSAERAEAITRTDLLYALVVAAGPGLVGHFVMTWPLRWVPANVPPVMRLGVPILASVWAWWLLGEQIGILHVLGGVVTLGGVAGALLTPSGRRFVASEAEPLDQEPSSG